MHQDWNNELLEWVRDYEEAFEAGATMNWEEHVYEQVIEYYLIEHKFSSALDLTHQARLHFPFNSMFQIYRALVFHYEGQHDKALHIVEDALNFYPGDFELQLLKAQLHIAQEQFTEALALLKALTEGLEGEPLSEALFMEAWVYEEMEDFKRMYHTLERSLRAYPEQWLALEKIGFAAELSKELDAARALYTWLIDENPYAHMAWFQLGQLETYLGNSEAAMEAFEYAFLTNADFQDAYIEYAASCMENKYYDKALDALNDYCQRFEPEPDVLLSLGICNFHNLQFETARQTLERAARLDAYNDEIFYWIGECFAAQEKWQQAKGFFRKAIRLDDERDEYYGALAEASFELGEYDKAEAAYAKALELAPEALESWLNMAWFLMEQGRDEEALNLMEEADFGAETPEFYYAYIACLYINGKRNTAHTALTEALQEDYFGHTMLFDWAPILRTDGEVNAIIALNRPDTGLN